MGLIEDLNIWKYRCDCHESGEVLESVYEEDIENEIQKTKTRILERLDEWAEEHQLNDPAIMYKRKTEQDMIDLFQQMINKAFGGEK